MHLFTPKLWHITTRVQAKNSPLRGKRILHFGLKSENLVKSMKESSKTVPPIILVKGKDGSWRIHRQVKMKTAGETLMTQGGQ